MGKRILVIEDDEKSRRLLTDVLGYHGHEVHAYASGEEALLEARSKSPQAALIDIQLPGIDGFAVIGRLREECANPALVVMAVTASVMDQERARIVAAGFDACLAKPVNIRQLVETLDALLGKVPS